MSGDAPDTIMGVDVWLAGQLEPSVQVFKKEDIDPICDEYDEDLAELVLAKLHLEEAEDKLVAQQKEVDDKTITIKTTTHIIRTRMKPVLCYWSTGCKKTRPQIEYYGFCRDPSCGFCHYAQQCTIYEEVLKVLADAESPAPEMEPAPELEVEPGAQLDGELETEVKPEFQSDDDCEEVDVVSPEMKPVPASPSLESPVPGIEPALKSPAPAMEPVVQSAPWYTARRLPGRATTTPTPPALEAPAPAPAPTPPAPEPALEAPVPEAPAPEHEPVVVDVTVVEAQTLTVRNAPPVVQSAPASWYTARRLPGRATTTPTPPALEAPAPTPPVLEAPAPKPVLGDGSPPPPPPPPPATKTPAPKAAPKAVPKPVLGDGTPPPPPPPPAVVVADAKPMASALPFGGAELVAGFKNLKRGVRNAVTAVTGLSHAGSTAAIIGINEGTAGKAPTVDLHAELKNMIGGRRAALDYEQIQEDKSTEWSDDDDEDNEDNAAGASGVCASGRFGLKGPKVNSAARELLVRNLEKSKKDAAEQEAKDLLLQEAASKVTTDSSSVGEDHRGVSARLAMFQGRIDHNRKF